MALHRLSSSRSQLITGFQLANIWSARFVDRTAPNRLKIGYLQRRARREGIPDGRSGAVAIVQRFGSALNLNVHPHALVLDGAFAVDGSVVAFHPMRRLTREDVAGVVALIAAHAQATRARARR